jgi:hypothetical protein
MHIYVYIWEEMGLGRPQSMDACKFMYIRVYVCIMYIRVYVCMYIYVDIYGKRWVWDILN